MPHDLVIKGGTIVDGTGADRFTGDLAIEGDRIVDVLLEDLHAGRDRVDVLGRMPLGSESHGLDRQDAP